MLGVNAEGRADTECREQALTVGEAHHGDGLTGVGVDYGGSDRVSTCIDAGNGGLSFSHPLGSSPRVSVPSRSSLTAVTGSVGSPSPDILSVDPVDLPTTSGKPNQCPFSYVDPVDKWLIFTNFMSMCPKVIVDHVDKW